MNELARGFVLAAITVDCQQVSRVTAFWSALFDNAPVSEPLPGWGRIGPLTPDGLALTFQPVPEPKPGKNRVHIDLVVDDVTAATAEVLRLGGRDLGERYEYDEGTVVVLADPEGNEFCVVEYAA